MVLETMRAFGLMTPVLALSLLGTACSGGQQDEEKPEVTDAEAAAPEEAAVPADDVANEAAPAAPADADPAPVAASMTGGVEKNRVVRYVMNDDTPIHGQANASSGAVGKLSRGDKIMVVEESGWLRIADGMFVKKDHVSNKPVDRKRQKAVWSKPAK